ncbi:MAG TPA: N-acetylmuramoyl-L-alanine amidase [Bdellovibrionales bacterium]|nr:N-acetylmuramoyl-L-alanine amidase [Bdellovibrionales bacterium]
MIVRAFLSFVFACFAVSPAHALHVLIDPGHGGIDRGAVRGNLRESEIALKVALQLAELLRANKDFQVSLTREKDETVSLDRRTQIAKQIKADILVSIHLNSSTDKRAHGKEFYFQNQLPADEDSMFLASQENEEVAHNDIADKKSDKLSAETDIRLIIDDLKRGERIRSSGEFSKILYETWKKSGYGHDTGSRAIRQAPFRVVSFVEVPSVLVELGFLSSPVEGPRLATASYQSVLAKSLYDGIVKYKESFANPSTAPVNSTAWQQGSMVENSTN